MLYRITALGRSSERTSSPSAFAPYLVVLVHFNLLLQLQLLSRQLYAFDAAAPKEERIGGLRDRLHIFPYTYYLVARPGPIVRRLLGIVVGITLLVLPLATLLVLQLRFLAYQDQAVTWAQRVAVWLDVALVVALWPVIMDPSDSWRDYLRDVGSCLGRRWRMGLAWATVWVGVVLPGFVTTQEVYFGALWTILSLFIVFAVAKALAGLWRWWRGRRESEGTVPAAVPVIRGMPGLLLVVALGVPLPLGLLANGERWEEELLQGHVLASEVVYDKFRFLDLSEQVLLAKPAKPELIAQLREGDPEKVREALKQIERVKLRERSLREAKFISVLLPGADLRGAKLQGADLRVAQLQGAEMGQAELQGANLSEAKLQGADLSQAKLQGADLWVAQLQGADLRRAQLQGADLSHAKLQGANLRGASFQGAELLSVELYGASLEKSRTPLVDLQFARWTPPEPGPLAGIREMLAGAIVDARRKKEAFERLERAGQAGLDPPILESSLIDSEVTPGLKCRQQWPLLEVEIFRSKLFPVLEELACQSSLVASRLIKLPSTRVRPASDTFLYREIEDILSKMYAGSARFGLAGHFAALLDKGKCEGLRSLAETDKRKLRDAADYEARVKPEVAREGQSGAGKPGKEMQASPTPPPAIAPETP